MSEASSRASTTSGGSSGVHRVGTRRFLFVVFFFGALNGAGILWLRHTPSVHGVLVSVTQWTPPGGEAPKAVRVSFSRDVVPLDPAERPNPTSWIRCEPSAPGSARWISAQELLFEPEKPLLLSHEYLLTVAPPLDLPGSTFEGPLELKIRTPELKLLETLQVGLGDSSSSRVEEATLRLRFNGVVEPEDLRPHLRVESRSSGPVACTLLTEKASKEIDVRLVPAGHGLRVVLGAAVLGPTKRLELEADQTFSVYLTEKLHLTQVRGQRVDFGSPSLEIYFTSGVASGSSEELGSFFAVDPPVPFTARPRWSMVALDGDFKPGARYRVTVKKGLKAAHANELEQDETMGVRFPDRQPSIAFAGHGTFLSSQGNLSLLLKAVNVGTISLEAWRVHANNLVHALEMGYSRENFVRKLVPRLYPCASGLNETRDLVVDLRDLVGGDPGGVWHLRASSGPGETDRADEVEQLVSVSDIGISVKQAARGALMAWTVSLKTGEPLAGVNVSLRSLSNQLLGEATTGDDGIARFDQLPELDGPPHLVVASRESDMAYLEISKQRVSKADFDVGGRPYLRSGYEAYIFTDRGVYRPGETVRLRALVRGPGGVLPERFPVEIETLRPDGKRYRVEKALLTDEGGIVAAIGITPSAPTGQFTVRVALPGQGREDSRILGKKSFRVEEYMPQRLRVEVTAGEAQEGDEGGSARRQPGDAVEMHVRASHLFGLPAAGCVVDASWVFTPLPFTPQQWRGFHFGENDGPRLDRQVEARRLVLDSTGGTIVKVEVPRMEAASPIALRFTGKVTDVGGRAVSALVVIPVDPAPHYLGLRVLQEDSSSRAGRGKAVRFECAAVKPDGSPAEIEVAELVLQGCTWSSVLKREQNGRYHHESHLEYREITRQRVAFTGGRGAFELTLPDWGSYRLRLKDPASLAAAELSVFAGGPGAASASTSLEKPERLEIEFGKDAYRPGETAHVAIKSPFKGTLLLTLESDKVDWLRVLRMDSAMSEVDIPLPVDASSEFFVGASVVRGIDPNAEWLPHRASGLERVPLELVQRRLTVTLEAAGEARPESACVVRAHVAREEGQPVAGAEVLLAAVDEGILSLTQEEMPDPYGFFYGKRAHAVDSADTFLSLLEEVPLARERSRPGGDGSGSAGAETRRLSPVNVKRVTPAVLWLGPFKTDSEGQILERLLIPKWTGELRLTAVASRGAAFGSARRALTVRGPFFFELGMPRFLSPADSFDVPVALFNRSASPGSAELFWSLENLHEGEAPPDPGLSFASLREPKLDLSAWGTARASFRFQAGESIGKANARLDACLGGESHFESIDLPVRPAAPLTTTSSSGAVTSSQPLKIEASRRFADGTQKWKLVVSDFPLLDLAESLEYLISYPHGCVEQTTSRVFPLLYLRDLVAAAHVGLPDGAVAGASDLGAVERFVKAGIDRLLDMQSEAGWLSMYPGMRSPASWGSVYATHFLVEAKSAGYQVPERELAAALGYVEKTLVLDPPADDASRLLQAAYGAYVLALAQRPNRGAMNHLRELILSPSTAPRNGARPAAISPSIRTFLSAAFLVAGDRATAAALEVKGMALPEETTDSGGVLRSPAREDAILLATLLDANPQDARIPELMGRLRDRRRDARWSTTQENAFALLAFGKYARQRQATVTDFTAEMVIPGQGTAKLHPGEHRVFSGIAFEGAIEIHLVGEGQVLYWWTEEGVPRDGVVEELDSRIKIRRELLDSKLKPLSLEAVPFGEEVVVKWTLEAEEPLENVVVTDLLPAGLEVENPDLGGASVAATEKELLRPDHVSLRDDRVLGFFSLSIRTRGVFFYAARAVTRGSFRLPAISAEAMYLPGTRSVNGAGRVIVK